MCNAPVICIHGPLGAGDTRDIVGLKCRDLTSSVSRRCRRCAGVLISRLNSLHSLIRSSFPCLYSIFNNQTCQILNLVPVAGHASLNCYGCKTPKTYVLMKWLMCAIIEVLLFGVLNSNSNKLHVFTCIFTFELLLWSLFNLQRCTYI